MPRSIFSILRDFTILSSYKTLKIKNLLKNYEKKEKETF